MTQDQVTETEREHELTAIPESKVAVCPNCNTVISGPFCPACGQNQKNLNRYFWTLAGEALDDVFRLDSRIGVMTL